MNKKTDLLVWVVAVTLLGANYVRGDLIHSINFDDAAWTVTAYTTGNATAAGAHQQSGGTITAVKGSGSSGTTAGFQISLDSSISTVGFTDIELHFTLASNSLEWSTTVAPDGTTQGTDGLAIVGQGVDFQPHDGIVSETNVLDPGGLFTPDNAAFGQPNLVLRFDSSADDGAITNLTMAFQSDAAGETLQVSGFEIHGTAVPEPNVLLSCLFAPLALSFRRRRSTRQTAVSAQSRKMKRAD